MADIPLNTLKKNNLVARFKRLSPKTKITIQFALFLGFLLLIPLTYLGVQTATRLFSKATSVQDPATITFSPAILSNLGEGTSEIQINFNTQYHNVDGVQLAIDFTGSVPADIQFNPASITGLTLAANQMTNTANGKRLTMAFITSNPTVPFTTHSQEISLGKISYATPSSGSMNIVVDNTFSKATRNGDAIDILAEVSAQTISFAPTSGSASLQFANLNPANPQNAGQVFNFNVVANTGGQQVSGVDAIINYDPSKLQINSVAKPNGSPFSSYPALTINSTSGQIRVSANIGTSTSAAPVQGDNIVIAHVTGLVKNTNQSTNLSYEFSSANSLNDSNIVKYLQPGQQQEPQDLLANVGTLNITSGSTTVPTATPTPTVSVFPTSTPTPSVFATPTPTQSPSVNVNQIIKVSLQGKRRPDFTGSSTATVKATNTAVSANTVLKTVVFDQTGTGNITMNTGGYVIGIKFPGYLGRKFGAPSQLINVTTANQVHDFSTQPFLGGEFNGDEVINEVDYVFNFLPKFSQGTATVPANTAEDLDGSGQVNNLDFSIMRSNWGQTGEVI